MLRWLLLAQLILGGMRPGASIVQVLPPDTGQQAYIDALAGGLDVLDAAIAEDPSNPVTFTANLFYAHPSIITSGSITGQVLSDAVDILHEAGVEHLDINPGLEPWFSTSDLNSNATVAKYDAAIARGVHRGMHLQLNPVAFIDPMSFATFKSRSIAVAEKLVTRYDVDVYTPVHETTTVELFLTDTPSHSDWVGFVEDVADAIHAIDADVEINVGFLPGDYNSGRFEPLATSSKVDRLAVDVYFLSVGQLNQINLMAAAAGLLDKPISIEETWRTPYDGEESSVVGSFGQVMFREADLRWMSSLAKFASIPRACGEGCTASFEHVTFFWLGLTCFSYTDGTGYVYSADYIGKVLSGIAAGQQSAACRHMTSLIQEYAP